MNLLNRILSVLQKNDPLDARDVIWTWMRNQVGKIDLTEATLENMCQTDLVRGFCGVNGRVELVRLAEALGISGISNPENDAAFKRHVPSPVNVDGLPSDEILDRIQSALPFPITFPTFHGNCFQGLPTKYGVTSNRHIFYLWVLKRIIELCPSRDSSILEIGAGFGVLGHYLDRAGYRDYTTIDLALINACQTYFLARNLPERKIILSGETEKPFDLEHKDSIKLLHSTDFKEVPKGRFSIMVNMDGLTEFGLQEASKYVKHDCAPMLFSINHEVNSYRVCDIDQPHRKRQYRYPFWLRDGYVEELYVS
jgi:hypothetical protein